MKKIYSTIFFLSVCALVGGSPLFVWGAPLITNVQGSLTNAQSITISGSGFGSTGPAVVLFDDFEKGNNGNIISTVEGSAQVGQWDYTESSPDHPIYSTSFYHSGSKSMLADQASSDGGHWAAVTFPTTSNVFVSHWVYLPSTSHVPGAGGSYGANWKVGDVSGGTFPYYASNYTTLVTLQDLQPTEGFQGPNPWHNADGLTESGYTTTSWRKGVWHRFDNYYAAGKSSNGVLQLWEMNASTPRVSRYSNTNATTIRSSDAGWTWFRLHSYGRQDSNARCFYDDVYVAVGPAARARVEICNNASYSSAKNCAISTPTSWSNTLITATVRAGSFPNGAAYLFVVDSTGTVSTNGYPITIGGGGGETPPSAPNGLHLVD